VSDDAHDVGAEQALLGSVLVNAASAGSILLTIPPDAWYRPKHGEIAAVLGDRLRRNVGIDPQTVLPDLLSRRGWGAETGPYLHTLMRQAWNPGNAQYYAERVLHCAARRKLSQAAMRIRQSLEQSWLNGCNEPITQYTAELRQALDSAEMLDAGVDDVVESTDVDTLLATQDEYDWLVPGLLERGERIVLTGAEGLGKSVFISQFAACLAAGLHPFTGYPLGDADHSLRVLIVDCENSQAQTRRRFRNLARVVSQHRDGDDWKRNLRFELRPNGLNLLGEDTSWLERRVAANSPDLLVIGPLYRMHYANINDEQAARELVRVLDHVRTKYGCALLSEAHAGHALNGAGKRSMRPSGSSLFLRWPEFGYGLQRAEGVEGEHPSLVDVDAWRGSREERQWPKQLKHGDHLPWIPADPEYFDMVG
jgi:hypothetical protein